MDKENIRTLIKRFVAEYNNTAESSLRDFNGNRDLFKAGDLDSAGFVELLTFLAEQTGRDLNLTEVDLSELTAVENLIEHFQRGNPE